MPPYIVVYKEANDPEGQVYFDETGELPTMFAYKADALEVARDISFAESKDGVQVKYAVFDCRDFAWFMPATVPATVTV